MARNDLGKSLKFPEAVPLYKFLKGLLVLITEKQDVSLLVMS
jgi:hypothetical protein